MRNKILYWILYSVLISGTLIGCQNLTLPSPDGPNPTKVEKNTVVPITKNIFLLDTFISVTLYEPSQEALIEESFSLCKDYESMFSRTLESSELYQINQKAITQATDEIALLLQMSLNYSEMTNGAFDITIAPLSELWNFSSDLARVPPKDAILDILPHVGYEKVQLRENQIQFSDKQTYLDFGAIAKGYIADQMKSFLMSKGVESGIINLGGNILCIGSKPDGTPYKIGVQDPKSLRGETLLELQVEDISVVTSGTYERSFEENGITYHHILNPKTGYPYDTKLASVTIISEQSVDGDALSTSCIALGLEKGLELIHSLENVYAIFITNNSEIIYSDGLLENIKIIEE